MAKFLWVKLHVASNKLQHHVLSRMTLLMSLMFACVIVGLYRGGVGRGHSSASA